MAMAMSRDPPFHPPPPPPPLPFTTSKKPRKKSREVSSRYLSTPAPTPIPTPSSNSRSTHRRSPSVPSSPTASDSESDENQIPLFFNNNTHQQTQRRRPAVKLFADNGTDHHQRKPRPGTPVASISGSTLMGAILTGTQLRTGKIGGTQVGRTSPFRSNENCSESSIPSSMPKVAILGSTQLRTGKTGGAQIKRSSSFRSDEEFSSVESSSEIGFCESPPIMGSRVRSVSEFRSSMPEADLFPTMSSRRGPDGNGSSENSCCRSLNLGLSTSQQNPFNSMKSVGRFVPSKICLPPQAPSSKLDVKGKKGANRLEDAHSLKILYNQFLQWRFLNAKAKVARDAKTIAAEVSEL